MMTSPSKNEWWQSLSKAEKAIYAQPDDFFRLCSIYISRYQGNLFMARNAHKAIFEGAPVPTGKNYEEGCARIHMFKQLSEYALIRDYGADRDGAIDILNLG
jgi:hypothetical protein